MIDQEIQIIGGLFSRAQSCIHRRCTGRGVARNCHLPVFLQPVNTHIQPVVERGAQHLCICWILRRDLRQGKERQQVRIVPMRLLKGDRLSNSQTVSIDLILHQMVEYVLPLGC